MFLGKVGSPEMRRWGASIETGSYEGQKEMEKDLRRVGYRKEASINTGCEHIRKINTISEAPMSVESPKIYNKIMLGRLMTPRRWASESPTVTLPWKKGQTITCIQDDAIAVHFLHSNALVVRAIVTRNDLKKMLMDNGNLINIKFRAIFDKMEVDHELTTINSSLYGFISNNPSQGERSL